MARQRNFPAVSNQWSLPEATIRKILLEHWGRQSCWRYPEGWSDVFADLMRDAPATPGGSGGGRASLRPALDAAVAELTKVYAAGPPNDAALVVWRAFPKLSRDNAAALAAALAEAGHGR